MDELTFTDLAVLEKIDENTVVEKFGTKINSAFFDAANILGTLKQKGLLDIKASFPGPSEVFLTDKGKMVMSLAKEKAAQELDRLDEIILQTIANGYKDPKKIEEKLNIRSSDLAYHLQRLAVQNFASYNFRSRNAASGNPSLPLLRVEFALTEQGFARAGYPQPPSEEELKKDSDDIAEIIRDRPPAIAAPARPLKMDKEARMKAKLEYYSRDVVKYAVIGVVVLAIAAAAAYYWLFLRH